METRKRDWRNPLNRSKKIAVSPTPLVKPDGGNIYAQVERSLENEEFRNLVASKRVKIERIVSTAHKTPQGEWLEQARAEWVIVLKGSAGLLIEGEAVPRALGPGDYLNIPERCRHRVEWTAKDEPTIWLAVHY
jgi:cupin 2 domain-containing protein